MKSMDTILQDPDIRTTAKFMLLYFSLFTAGFSDDSIPPMDDENGRQAAAVATEPAGQSCDSAMDLPEYFAFY